MSEEINCDRRRFLGAALITSGAKPAMLGAADTQFENANQAQATTTEAEPKVAFNSLKHIDAGVLNVGYAEDGPSGGPAVILLHGWPVRHPHLC